MIYLAKLNVLSWTLKCRLCLTRSDRLIVYSLSTNEMINGQNVKSAFSHVDQSKLFIHSPNYTHIPITIHGQRVA